MRSTIPAVATTFSVLLAFGSTFFFFLGIPSITRQELIAFRRLEDGTGGFSIWKKLPIPLQFKVYIFNITNPNEVIQGKNPVVKEIGPYVYDFFKSKINYTFDGDTVSYMLEEKLYFNEKLSGCRKEDDVVTVLNIALMGIAATIKKVFPMGTSIFNQAIPHFFIGKNALFRASTVKEILFDGIPIYCNSTADVTATICESMVSYLPPQMRKLDNSSNFAFSFFYMKNNTAVGPFKEMRGIQNISNVGAIIEFKNHPYLKTWKENSTCDEVKGFDLTSLPPFINANMDLYLFVHDLCSALRGQFAEEGKIADLTILRFSATPNILADPRFYSENRCYCREEEVENCLKSGIRDMEPCHNAPIILSFPHLYQADKEYQSYVTGLHPNKTLHETFVEVDPLTGYPVQGAKRIQMNMFLEQIEGIDILANISNGLLPLLWVEEGLEVTEVVIKLIGENHHKIYMLKLATVMFIILFIIIALCTFLLYLYMEKLFCFKNIMSNRVVALFHMSHPKDETDGINKITLSTIPDSVFGETPYGTNRGHYPHNLVHRTNNVTIL